MEKMMNSENISQFAYLNDKVLVGPIKGIVLRFLGLGSTSMFLNEITEGEYFGEQGILYVIPYNNPWSWMNQQAVQYTDEIIDVILDKFNLSPDIPLVSSGGSMGGQSALVYMAYAKKTPVSCVVNCPVCDVVYHFTERVDLPRTLYSAVANEEGNIKDALKRISPIHIINKLPKVSYHVFHCDKDMDVNIDKHSRKFVELMKANGFSITFDVVLNRGHCDLTYSMKKLYGKYILDSILNK